MSTMSGSNLYRSAVFAAFLLLGGVSASFAGDTGDLVIGTSETSGLDGRDWNKVSVGERTVDAVHRSVLVRFPGSAEVIRAALAAGEKIVSAEIQLDFAGTELEPRNYLVRHGLGMEVWQKDPPSWHIVAVPLRQPWIADPELGPTYASRVNGREPWGALGATSPTLDRFAVILPPVELSTRSQVAHVDITTLLGTENFPETLGMRLRLIEECGFVLTKLEEYDSRYRTKGNAYEWAVPTGGHGLTFSKPRLVVRFGPGGGLTGSLLPLPPPASITASARSINQRPALKPDWEDDVKLNALLDKAWRLVERRPDWMSEEQFAHTRQLIGVGGDTISGALNGLSAGNPKPFQTYMRTLWQTPPRYWKGWGIEDDLILSLQLHELVPNVMKKHLARYWTSWLMPDVPTRDLVHPISDEAYKFAITGGGWRGRSSFFRGGFNYSISTQNFNYTAAVGAMLGGSLIGANEAIVDGRHGLEKLLLRLWSFNDGGSQELLDHYYLSITLSAQKMLADFGPTAFDRLAGRITLERTMEMLATVYHPEIKRLVAASGRARMSGVFLEQEGIYGALHVLSKQGVLKYLGQPFKGTVHGIPVWGYDFPPGRVGLQSLTSPWAPSWFARTIDEKRFPFWEVSSETVRGNFNPPLWRSSYLGGRYGLASQDLKGGSVDLLAQWAHDGEASTSLDGLGTLTMRYCVNICDLAVTKGGMVPFTGSIATFQNKNRAIIAARPPADRPTIEQAQGPGGLNELASVIALWNFASQPKWRLYVDGVHRAIGELPITVRFDQLITIEDGQSFLAIRSLPATDLGRDGNEVIIRRGGYGGQVEMSKAAIEPALAIVSYNLKRQESADPAALDWEKITKGSVGGFVIEMGDVTEYEDFAAFQRKMQAAHLVTTPDPAANSFDVRYKTGGEEMIARFGTDVQQLPVHFPVKPGMQTRAIQHRRINGQPPYLPAGLERDTSWSQQGTIGRLEKNGAVLENESGRKAYLIADQQRVGVLAYNPLPDLTKWDLRLASGERVKAEGKVGLLRVAIDREAHTLDIDHAVSDPQQTAELAKVFTLTGFGRPYSVRICGKLTTVQPAIEAHGTIASSTVDATPCLP
jgi:hypothetical protein